MKRSHALGAIVAGAATATGFPSFVRAQALAPLHMVLFPGETSATGYYAKELGMFAKAGLDVSIIEVKNGAAAAAAVAGGSMDVGFSNPLSVAQGHDRGLPFTILAPAAIAKVGSQSNGFVVVAKTSAIRSPKDFGGKTFAVDVIGGLPHLSVRSWIDKAGGDSSSVKFIEMAFSEIQPALNSARIDGGEINAAFDPQVGKPNDPLHMVGNSYDAIAGRFASSVWFGTTDWVTKNPEIARKFVSVMKQAAVWANAHPKESAAMLAPHLKVTPESIEAGSRVTFGTDMTPDLVQPVIDVAVKYGGIKTAFPARDMIAAVALK